MDNTAAVAYIQRQRGTDGGLLRKVKPIKAVTEGDLQEIRAVKLLGARDIKVDCFTRCFFDPSEWVFHQKMLPITLKYGASLN